VGECIGDLRRVSFSGEDEEDSERIASKIEEKENTEDRTKKEHEQNVDLNESTKDMNKNTEEENINTMEEDI